LEKGHWENNASARILGQTWERNFCMLASNIGLMFTPLQIGRSSSAAAFYFDGKWKTLTLPDITIWTAPGQHHEIKHKRHTKNRMYGLEVYRFNALTRFGKETNQRIYYTIHDWTNAPCGRNGTTNRIEDWVSADISVLNAAIVDGYIHPNNKYPSFVNGKKEENVPQYFWPIKLFEPLLDVFSNKTQTANRLIEAAFPVVYQDWFTEAAELSW
jgi:hypothetical protein